jgi:TonB family protein
MNEIKYCYDQELVRKAALEGRISVQFIIAGTGQVINSVVQSSTMNNVRVEGCVVSAVKRWDFPKPTGGGIAIVSYPFNFVAGAGN